VLGVALVGLVGPATAAERKVKVKFSDTQEGPLLPENAMKNPFIQRDTRPGFRSGDSLGGMTAAPFGPTSVPLPSSVGREQDVLGSRNTLSLTPHEVMGLTGDNINRALGVTQFNLETSSRSLVKNSGVWQGLFDEPVAPAVTPDQDWSMNLKADRPLGFDSGWETGLDSSLDFRGEKTGSTGASALRSRLDLPDDPLRGGQRDLVRENLNFSYPAPDRRVDLRSTDHAAQFRRLLGVAPAPGTAPLPDGTIAEGMLNAVNMQPDLTRRELNPVMARPSPASSTGIKTDLDAPPGVVSSLTSQRRSLADAPSSFGYRPALPGASELTPPPARRRMTQSPTVLDIPKRLY